MFSFSPFYLYKHIANPFQHGVLTGFHASMQMIEKNPSMKINRIPAAVSTLPEIMKNTGYKTFAITDNLNICEDEGFAVGFDFFRNFDYKGAGTVNTTLLSIQRKMNSHHPYFLYLHYNDPHTPYHSRAPWFIDSGNHLKRFESAYDSEISFTPIMVRITQSSGMVLSNREPMAFGANLVKPSELFGSLKKSISRKTRCQCKHHQQKLLLP